MRAQSLLSRIGTPARVAALAIIATSLLGGTAIAQSTRSKLSRDLAGISASNVAGTTRVILRGTPDEIAAAAARHGGSVVKTLKHGGVIAIPASAIAGLEDDAQISRASGDARVERMNATTVLSTGADQVHAGAIGFSYTGRGVGVAVIDSGISNHPDVLSKVVASVDFLGSRGRAVDHYGHGTHVAGSVLALAPEAHLVGLRVLDETGAGFTSDVIEAIDWAIDNRHAYNLRVINLSLGHLPFESYVDDPLTQAVARAVSAGVVVVASAGNYGKTEDGTPVIGAIVSPGTSPLAITVGAVNTKGTPQRSDDDVTSWSSRGPTMDGILKPDLVAPGSMVASAAADGSSLWRNYPERRTEGPGGGYLTLSGTSMSAAAVSGAVATLLEANPALTPLDVRIALQVTSSPMLESGLVAAGAGSLNALAALRTVLDPASSGLPTEIAGEAVASSGLAFVPEEVESNYIIWGNYIVWGNYIIWGNATVSPHYIIWGNGTVWSNYIIWGNQTVLSSYIIWGNQTVSDNYIIWGNYIVWGNQAVLGNYIIWGNGLPSGD